MCAPPPVAMTLTVVFIRARLTPLAEAEVAIRSCRNVMRESISDVSKRAKLRRPPGSGGGTEERRSLGWEVSERSKGIERGWSG